MQITLTVHDEFEDAVAAKVHTAYRLPIKGLFITIYEKIKYYLPFSDTISFYMRSEDPIKELLLFEGENWENPVEDMIEVSKVYPEFYFTLFYHGEKFNDTYLYCFHNGKKSGGYLDYVVPRIEKSILEEGE